MTKENKYSYSFVFILGLVWMGVFIITVFFTSIQFNPIQNKLDSKRIVYSIVPQGWAFFTRNPREAQVLLYEIKDNKPQKINHLHSSGCNLMGLNRRSSVYISEIQLVRAELSDSLFSDTEWNYQNSSLGYIPEKQYIVRNKVSNPLLCGEYLLVLQQPIPWAWSSKIKTMKMPAKIIRIKLICDE